MQQSTFLPPYIGWLHDGTAWRPVAEGESRDACWVALLRVKAEGRTVERLVLPRTSHPDRRRRPK